MSIPKKDTLLIAWGSNFDTKVTASPVTYSLTAAQALSFHTPFGLFQTAYNAVATAREAGSRSKTLTNTKDTAKKNLLLVGRELYALVQNAAGVADADKLAVGVVVRKTTPSPIPPPSSEPNVEVVSVRGRTIKVRLHDSTVAGKRGRPAGTAGAIIYSFVGTAPADDINQWASQGITGKSVADITLPTTVAAGATVWITAQWFNNAKQTGPAADPISTNIPGGLSAAA